MPTKTLRIPTADGQAPSGSISIVATRAVNRYVMTGLYQGVRLRQDSEGEAR